MLASGYLLFIFSPGAKARMWHYEAVMKKKKTKNKKQTNKQTKIKSNLVIGTFSAITSKV